ncbi:hypothetical protein CFE70_000477 [Pyrenophora teres f. teres 0-1]|uniref:Uncharacterized protein n=2 Tax=Pyrenophora teres f. teres TaxID=97479 RepID=E3RX95_PYRTT|nr:hypothetical protein PTT_13999 [Pyrenophora teres f. teres 0-1]KAE8836255.1 hypothetical protein HRS9139_04353 [Pyrenophora teres f. teres]KAE8837775.1 hypothetical protein PTNB85_05110 [Pyrenophora teres f. teres]KAE8839806.1 hypothetical protein HRS9122_06411 [Pyrenophora teres f. teres]KAE8862598.1 hypothetical protein PTNB29_05160 [Pyrenophora teres f. teres]
MSDWGSNSNYNGGWTSEVVSLDFLPVQDIFASGLGFMETQVAYPVYDETLLAFLDLATHAFKAITFTHERIVSFHKFLLLPAELRLKVYTEYLETASIESELKKHLHTDRFHKPCCIWTWPSELTICDRQSDSELPTAKYAPWLPALAITNKQVLGEVTICMLQSTEWFEFKYEEAKPFKIVTWFRNFLATFPRVVVAGLETTEGFAAIKKLNFPHAGKYNEHRVGRVIDEDNPDICLMLKCRQLDTMAMSFNWRQLVNNFYSRQPRELEEFLDFFHFRPILEHGSVRNVYLEGVYPRDGEARTLECMDGFAKWLVRGFRARGREVNVHVHKRWGIFHHRKVGKKVVLQEEKENKAVEGQMEKTE